MAFRELMEGLNLPKGASPRYRRLTALERMVTGELYEDLPYSFEQEKHTDGTHIGLLQRRPGVDFNLAYEITQDTLAELFGDEQFPIVKVVQDGEENEKATEAIAGLIDVKKIDDIMTLAYEEGVCGAVGIIVRAAPEGGPFYEVVPAKWCEPVYVSPYSNQLIGLMVTYPIDAKVAEARFPGITDLEENKGADTFWYRYLVGPQDETIYIPLPDDRYARLGEKDLQDNVIRFVESKRVRHRFRGRAPVLYTKNPGGKQRDLDGQAIWWPIRNACVTIDYTLSQAARGLRYSADPMLFIRLNDILNATPTPAGFSKPAGGMAENVGKDGSMVKGVTQTLIGRGQYADAKLLEINANGIKEEREYVKDLREYALEVIGGMKARAEHVKGAASGKAIDKQSKPLRRLIRRLRRPYGKDLLLALIDLTLYGYDAGAFSKDPDLADVDLSIIPQDARRVIEWPNDEVLEGQDLLAHVTAYELAAGFSVTNPGQLITPDAAGAKLAGDMGFHQPYESIKGTGDPLTPPMDPTAGNPLVTP